MSCGVCIEPFNKSTRKRVDCWCEYECCKECAKQYVVSCTEEAHCMNCKKQWNRQALTLHFGVGWVNSAYKKHLEKILVERELVRMPETMVILQEHRERRIRNAKRQELYKERQVLWNVRAKINVIIKNKLFGTLENSEQKIESIDFTTKDSWVVKAKDFSKKQFQVYKNTIIVQLELLAIKQQEFDENPAHLDVTNPIKKPKEFIRHCPNNECRGFLSTALKCELCGVFACGQCREIKGYSSEEINAHECDPNTVQTIQLMKKDTKACPKCGKNIFRISGCSQMYCPPGSGGCGAAFNWNTLEIERGVIHNPHYFDWIRQNGGQQPQHPQPDNCGRNRQHWGHLYFRELVRSLGDLLYRLPRPRTENEDLRLSYLENEITKQELEIKVQKRYKANSKNTEIRNILETLNQVVTDMFLTKTKKQMNEILPEVITLVEYLNGALVTICKSYNSKVFKITIKECEEESRYLSFGGYKKIILRDVKLELV